MSSQLLARKGCVHDSNPDEKRAAACGHKITTTVVQASIVAFAKR